MNRRRSRRDFLFRAGGGFGALALWSLLSRERRPLAAAAAAATASTIAIRWPPKPPQFAGKAKSVIWCFLDGGPSHLDCSIPSRR